MLIDLREHLRDLPKHRIVHVGGNVGEEGGLYQEWGSQVIWFEPRHDAAEQIRHRYAEDLVVEAAAGNTFGWHDLHLASNGQSSSLLEPETHLREHPEVRFHGRQRVAVVPLDVVIHRADGLVADVQGYEDRVLVGAQRLISTLSWVYLEVNRAELYRDCARIEALDALLGDFERVATCWSDHNWGDALWVRRSHG
jgi:FkbM family methyltransferase